MVKNYIVKNTTLGFRFQQKYIMRLFFMFSFLIGQTNFLDENTSLSTTVTFPKIQTSDNAQPPRIGRTGDFHTPELLGSITSPSGLTAMDVAWDGTYYYVSHGGNTDNVYRYDEQFNQVDYQFVNIDSRGLVQHPIDGKLYMKSHVNEAIYRINNDPFDGSFEFYFTFQEIILNQCLLSQRMGNTFSLMKMA